MLNNIETREIGKVTGEMGEILILVTEDTKLSLAQVGKIYVNAEKIQKKVFNGSKTFETPQELFDCVKKQIEKLLLDRKFLL